MTTSSETTAVSWKYKIERVSKGYIRATIHNDDLEQLKADWLNIHSWLTDIHEEVENVKQIEAQELEKLRLKSK